MSLVLLRAGIGEVPDTPVGEAGTDFERLGPERLRAIIERFLDRVFADDMIGFLFAGKPQARIREMEYRYAAEHLGGPVVYDGRTLEHAHGPLRLFDGHFARRRRLLEEAMLELGVPEDIRARWLAHTDAQRERVLMGSCR